MADGGYYGRRGGVAPDGTRTFSTQADTDAEREVAARIERAWGCTLHRFGALAPLDWYAVRHGRPVAVLELKSRSHPFATHPTVFLNLRKWLALQLAAVGTGMRGVFVVRWTDTTGWIAIGDIDGRRLTIGGCSRTVKSSSDIEPVIEVPVDGFRQLSSRPHPET